MPTNTRITDFSVYKSVLPYASEMFGVYQPLLGWKSKRTIERFHPGVRDSQLKIVDALLSKMNPDTEVKITDFTNDDIFFEIIKFNTGTLNFPNRTNVPGSYRFFITDLIQKRITSEKFTRENTNIWKKLVSKEALNDFMPQVKALLEQDHLVFIKRNLPAGKSSNLNFATNQAQVSEILIKRIEMESLMAGALNELFKNGKFDILTKIFFPQDKIIEISQLDEISRFLDPLENFDPKTEIGKVSLSPIGIIHLFREYFFEFDTFLGNPVEHIWLSPGSSLELIEIHTRKTTKEQNTEFSTESDIKTENSSGGQDDVAGATKDENQNNAKFGISMNAGGTISGGAPGVYAATGHAETSTSYGLENNQKTAKEGSFKHMKQQSDKISKEIKSNFKTTFKTTTGVEDVSSKRYVLQNNTQELINYELRRKMRQVGVQVQDIGTSLCWQTYVDLPGHDLGLAKLVHIGEPPDLAALPHPDQAAIPQPITKDYTSKLFFKVWWGDNDTVETYTEHGPLDDKGGANADFDNDYIHMNYNDYKVEAIPGYSLSQVVYDSCIEGKMVDPVFFNVTSNSFSIHLRKVNFDGDALTLKLKLNYVADDITVKAAKDKYTAEMATYTAEKARLAKAAFVKESRDRIKVASNIQHRKFEELREEERTIIYRYLIGNLLNVGVDMSNTQTRHIMAELIDSMFDVEKMLYFTAPDWWMPREHTKSFQNVGKTFTTPAIGRIREEEIFKSEDIVSWGGASDNYRPNYFITEDSAPAKLGSSLGWLLQLDGDNIRNAFLNAPWVKAVIPIRPGKEIIALNWLMKANVEGADGVKGQYQEGSEEELNKIISFLEEFPFDPSDPRKARYTNFSRKIANDPGTFFVTIEDALIYLSLTIKDKNEKANKLVIETVDGEERRYLPTEKVFEHGFDPLEGGFKAETDKQFDLCAQWVEVLPTDQIVAVEVKYDPKTGRQL
ncbi:MAG TPA: hypothetical protein VL832_09050 [Puia sp.]|jgi:hypothetical protein|nr:hypothetical protein [Puia sp.]